MVLNSSELNSCDWQFSKIQTYTNELFRIDSENHDTIRIKLNEKKLVMNSNDGVFVFDQIQLTEIEVDSLMFSVNLAKSLWESEVSYECSYTLKEVSYFYNKSVKVVNEKINSNHIYGASVNRYTDASLKPNDEITAVTVNVKLNDKFNEILLRSYYVFFIPQNKNNQKYFAVFSERPYLSKKLSSFQGGF